jgi:uncharacterized protein DUF4145
MGQKQADIHLSLDVCPQCQITSPLLVRVWQSFEQPLQDKVKSSYALYLCTRCQELVLTVSDDRYEEITLIWPKPITLPQEIPSRAKKALDEAIKTKGIAPSLSILSCSRSLEFMLRDKGAEGAKLFHLIKDAAQKHILVGGMKEWADEVRWFANDERHPDEGDATAEEAQLCIDFALAVAQNLFVLPARIVKGQPTYPAAAAFEPVAIRGEVVFQMHPTKGFIPSAEPA